MMEPLHRADGATVTFEIADAIAAEVGTAPQALDTPLYEAVDTEALDRLLDSDGPVSVTFEYEGYLVQVDDRRTVTVRRTDPAGDGR